MNAADYREPNYRRHSSRNHSHNHPSYLRGRGTFGRSIVTTSTRASVVRIRWRLQFDTILLRVRLRRGAEVSILSRVGGVLRRGLLGIVRVWAVRLLINWLIWGRRTWWRSHPACAGVRSLTVASAASGIEAAGGVSGNQSVVWRGVEFWDLRKAEEEDECAANDDGEGYPATPAVPVGAIVAVVAAVARGS